MSNGCIFVLFIANNASKTFHRTKIIYLFSSVFTKNTPNNTTPTFQEVGVVTRPLIFCRRY